MMRRLETLVSASVKMRMLSRALRRCDVESSVTHHSLAAPWKHLGSTVKSTRLLPYHCWGAVVCTKAVDAIDKGVSVEWVVRAALQ